ncbi:hypothetical protein Tsubulata_005985, partial [Turnera subulata]
NGVTHEQVRPLLSRTFTIDELNRRSHIHNLCIWCDENDVHGHACSHKLWLHIEVYDDDLEKLLFSMDNDSGANVSKMGEGSVFEVSDLSLVSMGIPAHEVQLVMSNETKKESDADDVIVLDKSQHVVVAEEPKHLLPTTKRVIDELDEGLLVEKKSGRSVRIQAWGEIEEKAQEEGN